MANIARLGVILGLNSAEFVAGIEAAKRKTKEMQTSLIDFANQNKYAALAIAATAQQIMAFSDDIADTADAYQTSIGNVLDLSEALSQSGGKAESAGRLLGQFTNQVDAAAQGTKSAQDAFARIGISLQDIATLDNEQLLQKTLNNLANIEDPIARNAIAFDLLGKAIRGVDITKMTAEMLTGAGATEQQKNAVSVLANAYDELQAVIFKTKLYLAEALAPAIKLIQINARELGKAVEIVGFVIQMAFKGAVISVGFFVESLKYSVKWVANLSQYVSELFQSGVNAGGNLVANQKENLETFKKNMDEIKKSMLGMDEATGAFGGRTVKPAKDSEAEKQKNMLEAAKLISVEYERQLNFDQQQLRIREQMVGYTENERKVREAINSVMENTSRKIDEITKARESAAGRGANEQVLAEYDAQIEKVREMGAVYAEEAGRITQVSIDSQRTFSFGWTTAFKQYAEDAYNNAAMASSMFNTFTNAMSQGIANFVQTGKFQFRDFVKSVLQGLLQIQLQMLAMRLVTTAINFGMGAMQDAYLNSDSFVGPRLPGKASGGGVTANTPYLVGERGPELFIPSRSGAIVPNGQLAGAMSGGPSVVYNGPYIANMQAIDTQSATQFLARNKDAVYAANMSASRSIPTSVR